MDDLKKCSKCGGNARKFEPLYLEGNFYGLSNVFYIGCDTCSIHTVESDGTWSEAVEEWNDLQTSALYLNMPFL